MQCRQRDEGLADRRLAHAVAVREFLTDEVLPRLPVPVEHLRKHRLHQRHPTLTMFQMGG